MPTAFVTGGTGFLGLNVVAALRRDGYDVVAIHRPSSNTKYLTALGAELRVCGLDDPSALAETMPEGVDAVFHVAGDVSWWKGNAERQRKANVDGTRHVVEAALRRSAKRFVHTSTVSAYGWENAVIREDTPSTAKDSWIGYVRTKWEGEQEVRKGIARGLNAVIMNPANILGPYDTTSWARMFGQIKDGKLPGVPPGSGSFCHAREVARAHVAAVSAGRSGEQYLLGGTDATYAELASLMAECLGKPSPRVLPGVMVRLVGRVNDLVSMFTGKEAEITAASAFVLCSHFSVDSSKAERELGFSRVPLREMVHDSYQWLRTEGLI